MSHSFSLLCNIPSDQYQGVILLLTVEMWVAAGVSLLPLGCWEDSHTPLPRAYMQGFLQGKFLREIAGSWDTHKFPYGF